MGDELVSVERFGHVHPKVRVGLLGWLGTQPMPGIGRAQPPFLSAISNARGEQPLAVVDGVLGRVQRALPLKRGAQCQHIPVVRIDGDARVGKLVSGTHPSTIHHGMGSFRHTL